MDIDKRLIEYHEHKRQEQEEEKERGWFSSYVEFVKSMKIYPGAGGRRGVYSYALPALAEEVGELASIFAKASRDRAEIDMMKVNKEAGDIIFDVICILTDCGINPVDTIDYNRIKLESRRERGVIGGSGDDR